ncbi:MAG: hypothetical protein OEQ29_13650 [Alphaproteobacteria bacterium]|nr:hypothetical protein [Alphaproteobacteria bacterium]
MSFQDPMQDRDITGASAAGSLFARKGEASPVGGRPAPRRTITMRTPSTEGPARLTGELLTRNRSEPPRPANTSAPEQIPAINEAMPHRPSAPVTNAPVKIVPDTGAIMGPVVGPPTILAARHNAERVSRRRAPTAIRGPLRPASPRRTNRTSTGRAGVKRTTLRLDAGMRARLARFAASETLSVQTLLTRALKRRLPAIIIQRPGSLAESGPSSASSVARGGRRSVRFEPHLFWRLKTAAAKHKCSMQSIMTGALMAYLDELETSDMVADGAEMTSASLGPIAGPSAPVTFVDRRPVRLLGTQHAA